MLMGMGSLASIAAARAPNLAIAVLDNARFGETGSQHSHTGLTTDLEAVAAACGWTATATARDMAAVEALRPAPAHRGAVRRDPHQRRRKAALHSAARWRLSSPNGSAARSASLKIDSGQIVSACIGTLTEPASCRI